MEIDRGLAGPDPDEDLVVAVKQARDGDLRAFEELVIRHQKRILADCRYLTRDENNSEDLAQEVFVKAFLGLKRFEGKSTFRHWLQRIKVNHCLNHLKKKGGKGSVGIEETSAETYEQLRVAPNAETEVESGDQRRMVEAILSELPPALRVPLVMREMDELSYEEIATSLGLGLSAVKMRIKRGREHFIQRYEEAERKGRTSG